MLRLSGKSSRVSFHKSATQTWDILQNLHWVNMWDRCLIWANVSSSVVFTLPLTLIMSVWETCLSRGHMRGCNYEWMQKTHCCMNLLRVRGRLAGRQLHVTSRQHKQRLYRPPSLCLLSPAAQNTVTAAHCDFRSSLILAAPVHTAAISWIILFVPLWRCAFFFPLLLLFRWEYIKVCPWCAVWTRGKT